MRTSSNKQNKSGLKDPSKVLELFSICVFYKWFVLDFMDKGEFKKLKFWAIPEEKNIYIMKEFCLVPFHNLLCKK